MGDQGSDLGPREKWRMGYHRGVSGSRLRTDSQRSSPEIPDDYGGVRRGFKRPETTFGTLEVQDESGSSSDRTLTPGQEE